MSSKEDSERLEHALNRLPNVEVVEGKFHPSGTVMVLCRVTKGMEKQWASVVHDILVSVPDVMISHVCRRYFLREGALVYGWHLQFNTKEDMTATLDPIIVAIMKNVPKQVVPVAPPANAKPPLRAPQPDIRGNPTVPEKLKVYEMAFTGMDPRMDRNAPNEEGRGAFGMFKSRKLGGEHKPPTTKHGHVRSAPIFKPGEESFDE